jgi:hypothetical protein
LAFLGKIEFFKKRFFSKKSKGGVGENIGDFGEN